MANAAQETDPSSGRSGGRRRRRRRRGEGGTGGRSGGSASPAACSSDGLANGASSEGRSEDYGVPKEKDPQEGISFQDQREREWRAILDDPNSTKAMRDFALSQLNDHIGMGKIFDGEPEIKIGRFDQGDWIIVEDFEEGNWGRDFNGYAIVAAAADIILTKEGYDHGPISLSLRALQNDGTKDFLKAYPQLHKACTRIIGMRDADRELKSNAYVVTSFLQGSSSLEEAGGESMDNLKKALRLNPSDWRLHSMLSTRNMAIYNTALALESNERAHELAPDDLAKFSLSIRRGKILQNLNTHNNQTETIEAFEESISLYEDRVKNHPQMNDLMLGRLAVAQYMLVISYNLQGEDSKALKHYQAAEIKRNSINEEVAKSIDWSSRMLAQVIVANTRPGNVNSGECHCCRKVTDKPLRCASCKAVFYCGRECQVLAWKRGHKAECKQLKAKQKEKKAASKEEANTRDKRSDLPPLDVDLDPSKLWKDGVELSEAGDYEEAAWNFALALFMNFALDANDMQPVNDVVENCSRDNTLAMALSAICAPPKKYMQRSREVYEMAVQMGVGAVNIELGTTIADVDRNIFGIGLCLVIHARFLNRAYSVRNSEQAASKRHRDAFDDIARIVRNANTFIDGQRWLTMQFELGYTSMDVGAAREGEKWIKQFVSTIDKTTSLRSDPGANQHWEMMKASADSRLVQLPLLKAFGRNNPGFVAEDDCTLM